MRSLRSLRSLQKESTALPRHPRLAPPPSNVVNAAPLLLAMREVRRLSVPVVLMTDAQAEALAVLAALANGEPGILRRRAAAALVGLEIAPRPLAPCVQPAHAVGECIVARLACAPCSLNPARKGRWPGAGR